MLRISVKRCVLGLTSCFALVLATAGAGGSARPRAGCRPAGGRRAGGLDELRHHAADERAVRGGDRRGRAGLLRAE